MSAPANPRGRQVVSFSTTGSRAAQEFGLPAHLRSVIKRYDDAKIKAVAAVSDRAPAIAMAMIGDTYTIPLGQIPRKVKAVNTPDKFRLFASSLGLPLSQFNGHWDGRSSPGATAEVVRGKVETIPHAFIATGRVRGVEMPMIYRRKGAKQISKYGRYAGQKRQPIEALYGPSVYQMLTGTNQGGTANWVRLRVPLALKLKDLFFELVKANYGIGE